MDTPELDRQRNELRCQGLRENLSKLGVEVSIEKVPGSNWFAQMASKTMPMVIAEFYGWLDYPDYFFFWTFDIPALLILGYWFLIQFFTGFQMLEIQYATAGGVAWWAHVGGFTVGLLLALLLPARRARAELVSW